MVSTYATVTDTDTATAIADDVTEADFTHTEVDPLSSSRCSSRWRHFCIDINISGTSEEGTKDKVTARFYSNKDVYLRTLEKEEVHSRWWHRISCWNVEEDTTVDYVELEIDGDDGLLIKHAWMYQVTEVKHWLWETVCEGKRSHRWGIVDNKRGWCLSSDVNDWKHWESDVSDVVPSKTCAKRLCFASNGLVYKVF